jgi:hypothetical protein
MATPRSTLTLILSTLVDSRNEWTPVSLDPSPVLLAEQSFVSTESQTTTTTLSSLPVPRPEHSMSLLTTTSVSLLPLAVVLMPLKHLFDDTVYLALVPDMMPLLPTCMFRLRNSLLDSSVPSLLWSDQWDSLPTLQLSPLWSVRDV